MKIHTTQNLNSLVQDRHSTNYLSSRDFRFNHSEQMPAPIEAGQNLYLPAFKNKKSAAGCGKKVLTTSKKFVGNIAKEPKIDIKKGDRVIESSLFNWVLSKHNFEPVIQAAASALICMALRPATIMALPSIGSNKNDNTYAASHSFASGFMGLISAIIITTPFKKGGNYVTSVMRKNFKPEVLKRLYPQLKIESIWEDKAKNIRKPINEWLNNDGKKFIDNIKDIQFLPEFKQLADASEVTFNKILKLGNIDWVKNKGKSFNDIILEDGSKLYDKIDMSNLGIVVEENGFSSKDQQKVFKKAQILLQDLDKEYLTQLINDSKNVKESNWGILDINSVYEADGKTVKDFRKWKDINGKEWKLDLDKIHVASPIEHISRLPRITGRKRFDKKEGIYKFTTYQNNGINGNLGTAIDENIADTAARNEAIIKLLTWGPDIATRVPIAAGTIALIPWTLKHVFGLEKSKKGQETKDSQNKQAVAEQKIENKENKAENINFKGKTSDPDKVNWFIKQFGKYYGKPIIESKWIASVAEKLNKIPGQLTEHMMTLGSLITSSVYMNRTLKNKDLDPERKRTLAINQFLCFLLPTVAAYTVNHALNERIKKFEYRVSNKMQHAEGYAKYMGKEVPEFAKNIKNIQGIRILSSIGIFALTYRYITPVVITPIANLVGDWYNAKRAQKKAEEAKLAAK